MTEASQEVLRALRSPDNLQWYVVPLLVMLPGACTPESSDPAEPPNALVLQAGQDGRVELGDRLGRVFLRGGRAEAQVRRGEEAVTLSTSDDCDGTWSRFSTLDLPGLAGAPRVLGVEYACTTGELELTWRVYVDGPADAALLAVEATNRSGADLTVLRLSPLVSDGQDGGLFVGEDPARHRILDNGANQAMDTEANLHRPDDPRFTPLDGLLSIPARGDVVSNWNHAVVDLDSGRAWVAGALTVERAVPLFGTIWDPEEAPDNPSGEGHGFSAFYADQPLAFFGKPLAPGESVGSEWIRVAPMPVNAWAGLEAHARAVAAFNDRPPWMARGDGRPVPNGWNSWCGGGGSGGLGTNIDQTIMAESLEVMAREFAPFGVDYFQIDDGYQMADGDWTAREDRFPDGMAAFSQRVLDRGLTPGLWISAFTVREDSALAAAHPEWLADPEDNLLKGLLKPDEGSRVLDLSHPEVVDWLGETMTRYREEYRVGWIKHDFGYLAMPYRPRGDPSLTSVEAYKRALRRMDEALGDDVFFLGIGMLGVHFGVADGIRTTLDAGPVWEEEMPFIPFGEGNNFKSTVKTASRRWYMHGNLWVNHDDLLFFRTEPGVRHEVTLQEATTYASWMGLNGSIVKLGEDLRTLTPEQIDVWRRLLPSYPAAARPVDVFSRHYPERFRLPVVGTTAGSDASWLVVGLFHWGRNYDWTAKGDPVEMADEPRDYGIDLGSWGLDPDREYLAHEFWSQRFLGGVRGTLEHTLEPHSCAVIALRAATGRPQLLGHNRHLTQGATDLVSEVWDDAARSLTLTFDVDAAGEGAVPFEYAFSIHVPDGWTYAGAELSAGTVSGEAPVLTVRYEPPVAGRYTFTLTFEDA